ncbi:hypothetical protein KAI87_15535, partial [Myxococcota bacterium]|nr:hypothetical protein [Myxococcota bacterium]
DYQTAALETLLVPEKSLEADHLFLTSAYKKKLVETFKSLITQIRETHVKQLQSIDTLKGISMEPRPVDIYPKLEVEPFPTFYLRTARAYRFLAPFLETVLGSEVLDNQNRLLEDGERGQKSLSVELKEKAQLLYGLYSLSAQGLGMDPDEALLEDELTEYPSDDNLAEAQRWLESWESDADIMRDPRFMVAIGRSEEDNPQESETFYWATIGIKTYKIVTSFYEGYEPEFIAGQDLRDEYRECVFSDEFVDHNYYILLEEMVEVRRVGDAKPPTREEMRSACDAHDTKDDIIHALESL